MKISLILFLLGLVVCRCTNNSDGPKQNDRLPADTVTQTDSLVKSDQIQADTLYSIRLMGGNLSLQQWDSTVNLEQELGRPVKQKTRQLDQNSDTYAGSFIRELEYPGLKIKLFSPRQNGKNFWVQEIILTGSRYKTVSGIGLGDELEIVKRAYPTLQKFPGVNENMYYVANEGYEKSMEMEFEKNRLKKLRMYYMMN